MTYLTDKEAEDLMSRPGWWGLAVFLAAGLFALAVAAVS